jgi:hypothetical protein
VRPVGNLSAGSSFPPGGCLGGERLWPRLPRSNVNAVAVRVAFGIRLSKPSAKEWPALDWAVVVDGPERLVDHGSIKPPRSYSEAEALRHVHEAIATRVKSHNATVMFVWGIEGNARANKKSNPRIRTEGVACAAGEQEGAKASVVLWPTIASAADAQRAKDEYATAGVVCGINVGGADPQAVLVAVAALRS